MSWSRRAPWFALPVRRSGWFGRGPDARVRAATPTDRCYPVKVAVPRTGTAGPAAGAVFGVEALAAGGVTARGGLVAGGGVDATAFGVTVTFVKVEYIV